MRRISNFSFRDVPHLRPIVRKMQGLAPQDAILLRDLVHDMAYKNVYSLVPYMGSNWFVPELNQVGEDEPHWGVGLSDRWVLWVTMFGYRLEFHLIGWLLRVGLLVLMWYALYNIFGEQLVSPGGYIWDPLVTFVVSATVGGVLCRVTQLPPLLGVLWVAIMWNNIPSLRFLTSGVVKEVVTITQRIGLTLILARAGFSMSYPAIKPHLVHTLLLSAIPYGVEFVVHGLLAYELMGFDSYTWSFLQGAISSVIAGAVIVPGVLYLQEQGYGKGPGALSLMLSSISLELAFGVWSSNFILGLLFSSTPVTTAIVLGPVQIIGGAIIGVLCGLLFVVIVHAVKQEAAPLPSGRYTREHLDSTMLFALLLFCSTCVMAVFLGYKVDLAGGAAVLVVAFSATIAHMWSKDKDPELLSHKAYVGRQLAVLWDSVVMPVLFSMVGVGVDITAIFNRSFMAKAMPVVAVTTAARCLATFACLTFSPTTVQQKALIASAVVGKATVQAALGPAALIHVDERIASEGPTLELLRERDMAETIQQMSMLYVLLTVPICVFVLMKVGVYVLPRSSV